MRMRQAVGHVEEFSCSLTDYKEEGKSGVFSWNNIVVFSGLGLPSREAKGIHLSRGSALLSLFDGLMRGLVPLDFFFFKDPELNSLNAVCVCVRVPACVCVCVCVCVCWPYR